MRIFKFKSVKTKIILPVLIIVITMFSVSSYLKIREFRRTGEANLESQIKRVMALAALASNAPIYNFDEASIEEIVAGVMEVREVGHIRLFDTRETIGREVSKDGVQYAKEGLTYLEGDVMRYGSKVGFIEVGYSTYFLYHQVRGAVIQTMIELAILILILTVLIVIIVKRILRPINEFLEVFKLGGQGCIFTRADNTSEDEIGLIGIEFNKFMKKLCETIYSVTDTVVSVETENKNIAKIMDVIVKGKDSKYLDEMTENMENGIQQLEDYIQNVLDSVRSQTAGTEESLASIEEIFATGKNIGEIAEQSVKSSIEAVSIANNSFNNIENMAARMNKISESVKNTNGRIEELKKLSESIGGLVDAINNIAEQTNLLALNAAIEAARAGEAGKGFSVVAEEIRKLAEKTNGETEKIGNIIKNIQTEVSLVSSANEDVDQNVSLGLESSEQIKGDIKNIITMTKETDDKLREISNSMKEQNIASEEITKAIGNITENSTEIEEMAISTNDVAQLVSSVIKKNLGRIMDLADLAGRLKQEIAFFQYEEGQSFDDDDSTGIRER